MHKIGQHGTTAFSSPCKTFHVRNISKQPVHLIQKGQDEVSCLDDQISSPLCYWWPGNILYSKEPVFPSANTIFITLKKINCQRYSRIACQNSSSLLFSPLPRNSIRLMASLLEKLELLQERTLTLRVASASNCLFLAEQRGQLQQKRKGQPPAQRSSPAHCGDG